MQGFYPRTPIMADVNSSCIRLMVRNPNRPVAQPLAVICALDLHVAGREALS